MMIFETLLETIDVYWDWDGEPRDQVMDIKILSGGRLDTEILLLLGTFSDSPYATVSTPHTSVY